jgi:hypothetical protein
MAPFSHGRFRDRKGFSAEAKFSFLELRSVSSRGVARILLGDSGAFPSAIPAKTGNQIRGVLVGKPLAQFYNLASKKKTPSRDRQSPDWRGCGSNRRVSFRLVARFPWVSLLFSRSPVSGSPRSRQ